MAVDATIYSALSARAYAQQSWPAMGFHDHAAWALAKLLGIIKPLKNDPLWEQHYLKSSQWFDQRCHAFFIKYPQAMCIDLGAGLSTRFHRLSEAADWPQFSWVDVDLPEVIHLKNKAIPKIDNYRLLPANIAQDDWLAASGWHPHTPLIITLESVLIDLDINDIYRLFTVIAKHCTAASTIEIVFDYAAPQKRWYQWLQRDKQHLVMVHIRDYLTQLGLRLSINNPMDSLSRKNDRLYTHIFTTPQ